MSTGNDVVWSDIKDLYLKIDDLAKEKFCEDIEEGTIRPGLQHVKNSYKPGIPLLSTDETTPFGLIQLGQSDGVNKTFYQRFEFAYYNYRRDTGNEYVFAPVNNSKYKCKEERYYNGAGGNYRLPILHSMFLDSESNAGIALSWGRLLRETQFNDAFKAEHSSPSYTLVKNLTDQNLTEVYKWWPYPECKYSYGMTDDQCTQQAQLYAEIVFEHQSGDSCESISRICFTTNEDGSNSNNGNGNTPGLKYTIPFEPLSYPQARGCYQNKSWWPSSLTLHNPTFDVYRSERSDKEPEELNKSVPPICSSCVQITYPGIGYEGGGLVPKGDSSEEVFDKDIEFNVYPISLLRQQPTYWYNPTDKHLPDDGYYTYNEKSSDGKFEGWVWAEEVDKYKNVSRQVTVVQPYNGTYATIYLQYTNLRFMAGDSYLADVSVVPENELVFDRHDCVTVITAITVKFEGYVTVPMRKRWYDMMFQKLKFIAGYMEPSLLSENVKPDEENTIPTDAQITNFSGIQGTTWSANKEMNIDGTLTYPYCSLFTKKGLTWDEKDTLSSSFYNRSALNNFYFDQNLAHYVTKTSTGNKYHTIAAVDPSYKYDDPEEKCGVQKIIGTPYVAPWHGGASNATCTTGHYRTYWITVEFLQALIKNIEDYKIAESKTKGKGIQVCSWQSCAPAYRVSGYETWTYDMYYQSTYIYPEDIYSIDYSVDKDWEEVVERRYNYIAGDCVAIDSNEIEQDENSNQTNYTPTPITYAIYINNCSGEFNVEATLTFELDIEPKGLDAGRYRYDNIAQYGVCYCLSEDEDSEGINDYNIEMTPGKKTWLNEECDPCELITPITVEKTVGGEVRYENVTSVAILISSDQEPVLPDYYHVNKQNIVRTEVYRDIVNKIIYYREEGDVYVSIKKENLNKIIWGNMGYSATNYTVQGHLSGESGITPPVVTATNCQMTIDIAPQISYNSDIIIGNVYPPSGAITIGITPESNKNHFLYGYAIPNPEGNGSTHARADLTIEGNNNVCEWSFHSRGSRAIVLDDDANLNYNKASMMDMLDYSINVLQDTGGPADMDEDKCTEWVDISKENEDFKTFWCQIYKSLEIIQNESIEFDYDTFAITDSCDVFSYDTKVISSLTPTQNNQDKEDLSEEAWKTIDQDFAIELDPNYLHPEAPAYTPNESTNSNIRGIAVATVWGIYLVPSKVDTNIKLTFSSPMTRGALLKNQFRLKVPDIICNDNFMCNGNYIKPQLASCGNEDLNNCRYITQCNNGGKLLIKPWVIHDTIIAGDVLELEGKANICNIDDSEYEVKDYLDKGGQTVTTTIAVKNSSSTGLPGTDDNFNNRIIIGCTFILTSFDSTGQATGSNNLLREAFIPKKEYVKMNIKFE